MPYATASFSTRRLPTRQTVDVADEADPSPPAWMSRSRSEGLDHCALWESSPRSWSMTRLVHGRSAGRSLSPVLQPPTSSQCGRAAHPPKRDGLTPRPAGVPALGQGQARLRADAAIIRGRRSVDPAQAACESPRRPRQPLPVGREIVADLIISKAEFVEFLFGISIARVCRCHEAAQLRRPARVARRVGSPTARTAPPEQWQDPGKVFKGQKMAPDTWARRVTHGRTCRCPHRIAEPWSLSHPVKGAVPGFQGGWVTVRTRDERSPENGHSPSAGPANRPPRKPSGSPMRPPPQAPPKRLAAAEAAAERTGRRWRLHEDESANEAPRRGCREEDVEA